MRIKLIFNWTKMKFKINLPKKAYFQKKMIEKNVQFVSNILLRIKKEKLMAVLMFFVFHVLIIGVPNIKIIVQFAEPNLLQFLIKMKMEIFALKILIF